MTSGDMGKSEPYALPMCSVPPLREGRCARRSSDGPRSFRRGRAIVIEAPRRRTVTPVAREICIARYSAHLRSAYGVIG